jgi:hypothetical protein
MRHAEIEAWALRIIQTIAAGRRGEDDRVELKAEWPDPIKAARRLAGHANAARGDEVLWLLGVDENKGSVGVVPDDLADWWQKVCSHFHGPVPTLTPVNVHQDSAIVLALLMETTAAPFVVKNPAFGTADGGPAELEVPWREMTRTRSARHGDLIRLLVPQLRMPLIEVIDARLAGERADGHGRVVRDFGPHFFWQASVTLYVVPRSPELVVFPAHHVQVAFRNPVALAALNLRYNVRPHPHGGAIMDLVVERPTRLKIGASAPYEGVDPVGADTATMLVRLRLAGSDQTLVINCKLRQTEPNLFILDDSTVSTSERGSGSGDQ